MDDSDSILIEKPLLEVIYLPLPPPKVLTVPKITLCPSVQKDYDQVLAHFNQPNFSLPLRKKAVASTGLSTYFFTPKVENEVESLVLSDSEKCWLSEESILRGLRAEKGAAGAIQRIESTLIWRRENLESGAGEEQFSKEEIKIIEHESRSGKQVIWGYDKENRPIILMMPKFKLDEKPSSAQELFVKFSLERAIDLCPVGVDTLVILLDLDRISPNGKIVARAPVWQIKSALTFIQAYYYERLGVSVLWRADALFKLFFKLVQPFIDPETANKIHWGLNDNLISPEQLQVDVFEGEANFKYDHDIYFPALEKMCKELRDDKLRRWSQLGGGVGQSEVLMKGGKFEAE